MLHGQSDIRIGSEAFMLIRPLQKSGHSYFLHFAEQRRALELSCVKEVVKEVSLFIQDVMPPLTINQSCQCGAIPKPPHCYKIWEVWCDAVQSSIWPLHASGGSAIVSHPPYRALNHIFRSSIHLL